MGNISKTLEADLLSLGYNSVNFYDEYMNHVEPNKATEISILAWCNGFKHKTISPIPKKKLVDVNYVLNKIEKDSVYKSFSEDFKSLLLSEYPEFKNSINVYATTYGIGVFVAYGLRSCLEKTLGQVKTLLDKYHIEYKTELSDARYVFRFLISKSKENIERIKQLKQAI